MNALRLFLIAVLALTALDGSALYAARKGAPRRPAPKPRPAKKAPKPKPKPKKPARPQARKKSAPKAKPRAQTKVKPPARKLKEKDHKPPPEREHLRPKHIHRGAHFNKGTGELRFDKRWWHRFVSSRKTRDSLDDPESDDDSGEEPSPDAPPPPVVRSGQGLPISPRGKSLTALLNGMDVENHWLPGQKVQWKTGNAIAEKGGAASNGGAFVAAVCNRLKVPMPPPGPENFLPGSQHDWLLSKGKGKGWVAVGDVEAQLLANQGWVVIVAWKDSAKAGQRTVSGLTAIVRPDGKPAVEVPARGPCLVMAGPRNHNACTLKDGFPQKARKGNEVVYLAHRVR